MRWIPGARSGQWWIYAGISSMIVTVLLWIIRFVVLGQPFTGTHSFRFLLLAVILSFLFGFTGWLGARWLWLFSNIGLAAGLLLMALYARGSTGWEDLISFLVFLQAVAAGFALGLAVEGVMLVMRLVNKK